MLKCIFIILTIFLWPPSIVAQVHFSKVYFFGDSLTDNGNNKDGWFDQAPVTNKVLNAEGKYVEGETWTQWFVKFLKRDGILSPNASTNVVPLRLITSATINDSINFAYSGDPSGGFDNHIKTYHPLFTPNLACVFIGRSNPTENDLCGMHNRIHNAAINYNLDKEALYVIWVGANDILHSSPIDLIVAKEFFPKTIAPSDQKIIDTANEIGINLGRNIENSMEDLITKGAHNFLVINVPNIGYTPIAYSADSLYSTLHQTKRDEMVHLLNKVTNLLNKQISLTLSQLLLRHPQIIIYQPNINVLFKYMRTGKLAAFPLTAAKVNVKPTLAWDQICCPNQAMPNYNPKDCAPKTGNKMLCSNGDTTLPHNLGYYVFFGYIHPSTCTHKYIAQFLEAFIRQIPFEKYANKNLCKN